MLSAIWDSQLGTYSISLTHLFGAAELTLDSADLNGDGLVDLYDILAMADNWLTTGDNPTGDFDNDNIVNLNDFAILNQRINIR